MSHVDDASHDFEDLERTDDLPEEVGEAVRQARIQARGIIDSLEPRHVTSWADLLYRLEEAIRRARINANLYDLTRQLSLSPKE